MYGTYYLNKAIVGVKNFVSNYTLPQQQKLT